VTYSGDLLALHRYYIGTTTVSSDEPQLLQRLVQYLNHCSAQLLLSILLTLLPLLPVLVPSVLQRVLRCTSVYTGVQSVAIKL